MVTGTRRRIQIVQFLATALACGAINFGVGENWLPGWLGSVLVLCAIAAGVAAYAWITLER